MDNETKTGWPYGPAKAPTGAIAKAFAKAQSELHNPTFDSTNPHFKSKFASLATVRNTVIPVLAKHGIALVQELQTADGGVSCITHLYHESGESLHFGPLTIPATKSDAHGYASAATYARRYCLMSVAGVVGDDDDDANAAVEATAERGKQNNARNQQAKLQRDHLDSVTFIKDAIAESRPEDVAQGWIELSTEAKEAVWSLFNSKEKSAIREAAKREEEAA